MPLKSFITVERGVYKTGWEHDFFRDEPVAENAAETSDTLTTAPDDTLPPPDRDMLPYRQNGRAVKHRDEKREAEQPDADTAPEQIAAPPVVEEKMSPPPPEERPPAPPRPAEVKSAPARPQEVEQQQQTVLQEEPAEPKKKQKERARELEKKRKKGNFRDPKIAY
jgi:hypothetical protein